MAILGKKKPGRCIVVMKVSLSKTLSKGHDQVQKNRT